MKPGDFLNPKVEDQGTRLGQRSQGAVSIKNSWESGKLYGTNS